MRIYKIAQELTQQPPDDNADDNVFRRRSVKVTMDDGDVIHTEINGTKEEITNYYTQNDFTKSDEVSSHRGVKVEFLR